MYRLPRIVNPLFVPPQDIIIIAEKAAHGKMFSEIAALFLQIRKIPEHFMNLYKRYTRMSNLTKAAVRKWKLPIPEKFSKN
jgi:hypothetical protein